jgi:hypothetical protein
MFDMSQNPKIKEDKGKISIFQNQNHSDVLHSVAKYLFTSTGGEARFGRSVPSGGAGSSNSGHQGPT